MIFFVPGSSLWAVPGGSRVYFGAAGDTPVPGDYAGNIIDDITRFDGGANPHLGRVFESDRRRLGREFRGQDYSAIPARRQLKDRPKSFLLTCPAGKFAFL
ncbi:MAG: hypothetical protein V1789_03205 [PVC group bacterium]